MNAKTPLLATRHAIAAAQRQFTAACENADRIFEARLNEIAQDIQTSSATVASLESSLEMFDALEQIRMAAATRKEIATAIDHHRHAVDTAKVRSAHAWADYHTAIIAAAAKLAGSNIHQQ